MDRTPRPMEQYVHFKGGRYQVLNLAEMEETGEMLVIYQALYGDGKIYARPLSSFVSEVDKVKYPLAGQYWRFLRVVPPEPEENMPKPPAAGPQKPEASADRKPTDTGEVERINASRVPDAVSAAGGGQEAAPVGPCRGPEEADPARLPETADEDEEQMQPAPALLQFLEAQTAEEKLRVIASARSTLTDEMIDTMAFALGIEIEPGPIDTRYLDLRECLLTISRYEMDRERFRSTLT